MRWILECIFSSASILILVCSIVFIQPDQTNLIDKSTAVQSLVNAPIEI